MHGVQTDSRLEIFRRRLDGSANRIKWHARDAATIAAHMGLPSVDVSRHGSVERMPPAVMPVTKEDASTGQTYTFTISTGSVDRMGDTIDPDGWVLEPYRSNPVVLWSHLAEMVPVGKATKVWVQAGRLKATMRFVPESISPAAGQVKKLVDAGYLVATSVGFIPLKFSFSKEPDRQFGIDFHKQTLLEFSVVAIPANAEALLDGGQREKAKRQRELELIKIRAGMRP